MSQNICARTTAPSLVIAPPPSASANQANAVVDCDLSSSCAEGEAGKSDASGSGTLASLIARLDEAGAQRRPHQGSTDAPGADRPRSKQALASALVAELTAAAGGPDGRTTFDVLGGMAASRPWLWDLLLRLRLREVLSAPRLSSALGEIIAASSPRSRSAALKSLARGLEPLLTSVQECEAEGALLAGGCEAILRTYLLAPAGARPEEISRVKDTARLPLSSPAEVVFPDPAKLACALMALEVASAGLDAPRHGETAALSTSDVLARCFGHLAGLFCVLLSPQRLAKSLQACVGALSGNVRGHLHERGASPASARSFSALLSRSGPSSERRADRVRGLIRVALPLLASLPTVSRRLVELLGEADSRPHRLPASEEALLLHLAAIHWELGRWTPGSGVGAAPFLSPSRRRKAGCRLLRCLLRGGAGVEAGVGVEISPVPQLLVGPTLSKCLLRLVSETLRSNERPERRGEPDRAVAEPRTSGANEALGSALWQIYDLCRRTALGERGLRAAGARTQDACALALAGELFACLQKEESAAPGPPTGAEHGNAAAFPSEKKRRLVPERLGPISEETIKAEYRAPKSPPRAEASSKSSAPVSPASPSSSPASPTSARLPASPSGLDPSAPRPLRRLRLWRDAQQTEEEREELWQAYIRDKESLARRLGDAAYGRYHDDSLPALPAGGGAAKGAKAAKGTREGEELARYDGEVAANRPRAFLPSAAACLRLLGSLWSAGELGSRASAAAAALEALGEPAGEESAAPRLASVLLRHVQELLDSTEDFLEPLVTPTLLKGATELLSQLVGDEGATESGGILPDLRFELSCALTTCLNHIVLDPALLPPSAATALFRALVALSPSSQAPAALGALAWTLLALSPNPRRRPPLAPPPWLVEWEERCWGSTTSLEQWWRHARASSRRAVLLWTLQRLCDFDVEEPIATHARALLDVAAAAGQALSVEATLRARCGVAGEEEEEEPGPSGAAVGEEKGASMGVPPLATFGNRSTVAPWVYRALPRLLDPANRELKRLAEALSAKVEDAARVTEGASVLAAVLEVEEWVTLGWKERAAIGGATTTASVPFLDALNATANTCLNLLRARDEGDALFLAATRAMAEAPALAGGPALESGLESAANGSRSRRRVGEKGKAGGRRVVRNAYVAAALAEERGGGRRGGGGEDLAELEDFIVADPDKNYGDLLAVHFPGDDSEEESSDEDEDDDDGMEGCVGDAG